MLDIVIIGGGPAGLSAAVYGTRAGLDVLVIEKNIMCGGQIVNTDSVDNYLGMPGINGFDMALKFREHADKLGIKFIEDTVVSLENTKDKKIVHCTKKDYETKSVIVATGAKNALLNAPGEKEFTGRGVSYCATCDGAFYKGKTVAVNGGGDVALEDALYLSNMCNKVYLIHRRDSFRGAKILQDQVLKCKNIEIKYNTEILAIRGKNGVESISVYDVKTGEEEILGIEGLFVAVGTVPEGGLLKGLVNMDEKGYVVAGEDCETSISGIYVAGDLRKKNLRQIITAVSDGANAATAAEFYCRHH